MALARDRQRHPGEVLKGIGLEYLWPQTLVLLGMTVVLVAAATRSFRIRLA